MDNRIGDENEPAKGGVNQSSGLVRSLCGLLLCSNAELSRLTREAMESVAISTSARGAVLSWEDWGEGREEEKEK